MILVSRSSDRNLERRYHAAIPVMLGGIGLLLMGVFHSPVAIIALLSLLAIGAYGWWAPFFALPCEFLTGSAVAAGCRPDQLHWQHRGISLDRTQSE
jgi:MFS transporter, ACS family, tartrate transporter